MDHYKLKVRVGNAEFVAIGSEQTVKDQFDVFMGCLTSTAQFDPKGFPAKKIQPGVSRVLPPAKGELGDDDDLARVEIPPDLERAFEYDGNGSVSLKALPRTDAKNPDALLALLYGFRRLAGRDTVLGGDLLVAARQSGLLIDRVDRPLEQCSGLYTKAGQRRGAKYGLTNPGMTHAEKIVKELFA
jgi:hypothetical protein